MVIWHTPCTPSLHLPPQIEQAWYVGKGLKKKTLVYFTESSIKKLNGCSTEYISPQVLLTADASQKRTLLCETFISTQPSHHHGPTNSPPRILNTSCVYPPSSERISRFVVTTGFSRLLALYIFTISRTSKPVWIFSSFCSRNYWIMAKSWTK